MTKAGRPYGPHVGRAMDKPDQAREPASSPIVSRHASSVDEQTESSKVHGLKPPIQRERLVKTNASVKKLKWSAKSRWRVMMGGRR